MADTMPMILHVKRFEKDLLFMNVLFVFDSWAVQLSLSCTMAQQR